MLFSRILPLLLVLAPVLCAQEKPSEEVRKKLEETFRLQEEKRYAEALAKLDEIEAEAPNLSDLYNMRGAIYLTPGLRDFDKAGPLLDKAEELAPQALAPKFNKAEMYFIKHDWEAAAAAMQKLLDDFPKLALQLRHLTIYKRLICEVKLGKYEVAEKTLKEHFTFMDDTPAYYYGHAAIAFGKKEAAAAKDWLARAQGIFKPGEASAYLDALMESRWVDNIGLPPLKEK